MEIKNTGLSLQNLFGISGIFRNNKFTDLFEYTYI